MSTAAASATGERPRRGADRVATAMASRPMLLPILIVVALTALRMTGTVDSDVAWQLWIAARIHAGATLYRDIIETNPPLWFWMAIPVERASALLHLRIEAVLAVAIALFAVLSLALTEPLIAHLPPLRRALLLSYGALALLGMPWMHLGQREQIVLIATLPYAALIAARRSEATAPVWKSALIGVVAGLAFALKHYFLIVPGLLELWLLAGQGKRWRPLRPETIAIALVGVAYATAILLLANEFLTTIVPLLRLAYGSFGAPSIIYLFGPLAVVGIAILALVLSNGRALLRGDAPLAAAFAVAAIGFAVVYFIQFKGWRYHAIPLVGFSSLALAALIAESGAPLRFARLLAPAALILPLFLAADEQRQPGLPTPDLVNAVAGLKPGEPVGFLATETAVPWSVTLQGGYRYASRYNGYWMMPAIVANEQLGNPDARVEALGKQIVADTVADFTCIPPKRIVVARPRPGEKGFDILPFFLRDPAFGRLLAHYRPVSRAGLETYQLVLPLPPATQPCRRGV